MVSFKRKSKLKGKMLRVSFIAEDGYTAEFTMEDVKRKTISTSRILRQSIK